MTCLLAVLLLVNPTEPPAAYRDASGAIVGTNIDLGRAIAAELGEPLKLEATTFDQMLPRLKAGTADMAISGISITEARKCDVDFSMPYEVNGCAFLYPTNKPAPQMSRLANERIGAQLDTRGDMYLSRHGCDPIRYVDLRQGLKGVETGDVDALFYDRGPLLTAAKAAKGRYRVTPLETREGYGVAVSKRRPDVLKAANAAIARRRAVK